MRRALTFLLATGCAVVAAAHGFNPALLRLRGLGGNRYAVTWKAPSGHEGAPPPAGVAPQFPADCVLEADLLRCASPLEGRELAISGLREANVDAVVELTSAAGSTATLVLRPEAPSARVPVASQPVTTDPSFLRLGIEHILTGYDHLLFVLGLVLLVGSRWRLLGTITAFTLAHSLTLALTMLGFVRVAQPPVEACIALSILLLAVELAKPERPSITRRKPWVVAFVFGLLHGFGFAAALSEVGLPPERVPSALLLFNVGVELGQLAFVAVVLIALDLAQRLGGTTRVTRLATWAIGACAAFWCIDRVAAFVS